MWARAPRLSLLISLMMCFLKIPTILHINRVHWRHISTNRCSLKQEKYKERKSKEERKRQEKICCIFHNRSISIWNETEKNLSSLKRNYDLRTTEYSKYNCEQIINFIVYFFQATGQMTVQNLEQQCTIWNTALINEGKATFNTHRETKYYMILLGNKSKKPQR